MTADFAWDSFLDHIVARAGMKPTPAKYFRMRFGSETAPCFQAGTIKDALKQLLPDETTNEETAHSTHSSYTKQIGVAMAAVDVLSGCQHEPKRDRAEAIMQWLKQEFPRWLACLVSISTNASKAENLNIAFLTWVAGSSSHG